MTATFVIHNIGTLVTPADTPAPILGANMNDVIEIEGAAIAISGNDIVAVGREADVRRDTLTDADTVFLDARRGLATPGFVDCHAHVAFSGTRADEFELRNLGAGYEEIHAAGGGIASTVKATRGAIVAGTLENDVARHLSWMLRSGTTTAEAKSGYGLSIVDEMASLDAIAEAGVRPGMPRISATVLAAHSIPPGFDGSADTYIDEIAIPVLREAATAGRARQADIFLERGAFDAAHARRYLLAARDLGLDLRLHGDQFSECGAIELAIELGARSVDHLEATGPDGVARLAASDVCGVMLPLSSLFLGRPFAPARVIVDAGGVLAIASDFNPGSSYGESMTLAMSLACIGGHLRAGETLTAATVNAAWVLGLSERVGRLAPGYAADVVIVDQPDLRHLVYHVGTPGITHVVCRGRCD